jgi:predicted kinase
LLARVSQREHDASDADADIVRMQHSQGVSGGEWHRLDASASVEQVLRSAAAYLRAHMSQRTTPVTGATARTLAQ